MGTGLLQIADLVPWDDKITSYDLAHMSLYLRMLDAVDAGADPDEICQTILGRDPVADSGDCRKTFDSHLARARWISEQGYKDLLRSP